MLVEISSPLSAQSLEAALVAAKSLVGRPWLERQRSKLPSSHLTQGVRGTLATWGQIDHTIKHDLIGRMMHPIAEAIIASEKALSEYSKTGTWFEDPVFYRIISLSHIATYSSSIPGAETRLSRLIGADWRSAV